MKYIVIDLEMNPKPMTTALGAMFDFSQFQLSA